MINFAMPQLFKATLAAGALLGLGGCMYGGSGYYGDGYVNTSRYACDPYAPFDDYYACDYGYGFANIGYGGGWYDQYYYPGYGIYVFDRGGHRHAMRNHHRRYWAAQRARYGGHQSRDGRYERHDRRYDRRGDARDQRRGDYRDQRRGDYRDQRGARGVRGDRPRPVINRPGRVVEQPQARPQRAARPVPRNEGPRVSPRGGRTERENVVDE